MHVNYRHGPINTSDCGLTVRDSSQYMITTVNHASRLSLTTPIVLNNPRVNGC
ncbi:hypothetical protein HanXRQr2_Chr05g0207401 [Helianthus annuus]|uniref:Uncharacterized protein n=1 Tax=Helianthus annuus TaxID=4232 RepID=A0A9K3IYE9_HELAN|nr:hypothetical protein HanXRQr2_Chr05g0207401 [Helianthus annuus]KAJ0922148.1 hypothetical protein HanPSC8_Chr05g0200271 [Helianthus annuus]